MGKTTVVNTRTDKFDVYIGRPSEFGNPFKVGRDGTRADVIKSYRVYFYRRLAYSPQFKKRVLALKGKSLGCYCKPLPCHGDVIADYLNSLPG